MKKRYTMAGLVVLIAIGLGVWTTFISYHPQRKNLRTARMPDAYMEGVSAMILSKSGRPSMLIKSPKMTHFSHNDSTTFNSPEVTIYRESPKPWFINSKHGSASKGIDKVNFWGDVVVQHPADIKSPATIIKTNTLTVFPNTKLAETKDKITMIQPSVIVNSIGMHADMKSGNIELLSKTWGEYVPNS